MRLAAFQPDIPQNLGALMRLSVCFDAPLHVVRPCGFPFSAKGVKKAAMDYGAEAEVLDHASWETFEAERPPGRLVLLTTKATVAHWEFSYDETDFLVLGRESAGAPDFVHEAASGRVAIPMPGGGRSLNVAVSAGIVAAEALRQLRAGQGNSTG